MRWRVAEWLSSPAEPAWLGIAARYLLVKECQSAETEKQQQQE